MNESNFAIITKPIYNQREISKGLSGDSELSKLLELKPKVLEMKIQRSNYGKIELFRIPYRSIEHSIAENQACYINLVGKEKICGLIVFYHLSWSFLDLDALKGEVSGFAVPMNIISQMNLELSDTISIQIYETRIPFDAKNIHQSLVYVNHELLRGVTATELADRVSVKYASLHRWTKRYKLPRKDFGQYQGVIPINIKSLAKQRGVSSLTILHEYQPLLIKQLQRLLEQSVPVKQVARRLGISYDRALDWSKQYVSPLAAQLHMEQLQAQQLEKPKITKTLSPEPMSILKTIQERFPLLMQDPVLKQLPKDAIISVPLLKQQAKLTGNPLTDQQLRAMYKTEILLQFNNLLNQKFEMTQIAALLGISSENLYKMKRQFSMPKDRLIESAQQVRAKKQLKKFNLQQEILYHVENLPKQSWYALYKVPILQHLNQAMLAGADVKNTARSMGVSYGHARKLVKQYQLPHQAQAVQKVVRTSKKYPSEVTPEQIYPGNIRYKNAKPRTVTVGANIRIITARGDVISARQLLGKSKQELNELGPFLMFDKYNRLCSSDITGAQVTSTKKAYRITTRLGSEVILGSDSSLIIDDTAGLVPKRVDQLQKHDRVLHNKNLHKLPTYKYSFFDLIDSPDSPIYIVPNPEVVKEIKNRLRLTYGTIKGGIAQLGIKYRGFRENGRLSRKDLIKLYDNIAYPDITSADFSSQIDKIGIGGTKANVSYVSIDQDLMYLMGLVASDSWVGDKRHRSRSSIEFYNTEEVLIQKFIDISNKFFPERHVGVYRPPPGLFKTAKAAKTSNFALVRMINNLRVKGKDTTDEDAYTPLLKMSLDNIAGFIKGMFDGDGSVDVSKQDITIAIFNPERVKNAQLLLKKLNIDSKIKYSEQYITPPGGTKSKLSEKYELQVLGKKDLLKFIDRIGTNHPKKKKRFEQLKRKLMTQKQLSSKYNLAPIKSTELFKAVRKRLKLRQSDLGNPKTISSIETGNHRTSIRNVVLIMKKLKEKGATNEIPPFKKLLELISLDYNLDIIEETSLLTNEDLITITSSNKIIVDTGLILDES